MLLGLQNAINDYLANIARWVGKNRVNWLGIPDDISGSNISNGDDNYGGQIESEIQMFDGQLESMMETIPKLNVVSGEISGLMRTQCCKKGKGSRKG